MTLLGGRYTLDVPLGDSDLGTVWNAHDENGTHLVVVTLEVDAPAPLHERFRAHAKALVKTAHPNLVKGIAEGEENGAPYLVMERLLGESLATRLESGPAPTVARVVEIATALSDALGAVHAAGIAHGDVEPGNVLLVDEGGKEVPKLIGFGLNRASLRQELGVRMSVPSLGPVAYAAPEQARGEVLDGALADQASLAAIVYAALGGRPPHVARDVAALAAAIGSEKATLLSLVRRDLAPFASMIDRALSSDPKKRFADMTAFGRALKTAGTMARAIATSRVPLGPRSAIGEPPAPAIPRAAAIPKPAGALGAARMPGPAKAGIPKPAAAASVAKATPAEEKPDENERTTQEIPVEDLEAARAAPPRPPAPAKPSGTSTPQPPPKAPSAQPAPTDELGFTDISVVSLPPAAPAHAPPPPPPAAAHAPPHAPPPPPPTSAPKTETAEHVEPAAAAEPAKEAKENEAAEAPAVAAPVVVEPPAAPASAPPAPAAEAPPPASAAPLAAPAPPAAAVEATPAASDVAPTKKKEESSIELSPSMEKIVSAANAPPPADDVGAIDDEVPPVGAPGARPAWVVPAAIAAVVALALVSWLGYRATSGADTSHETPGRTLTVAPPPSAPPPSAAPETVVVPPPATEVTPPPATEVTPPPPTSTVAVEEVAPPPTTRVAPPPPTTTARTTTTRPPPTTTARTTTTHPPPTTTARTTTTRPPPTTTARTTTTRPPPTTGTGRRPTVVSDPGF